MLLTRSIRTFSCALVLFIATTTSAALGADDESYSVIIGETRVGHIKVNHEGDVINVDYEFRNNGRGPTILETIRLDEAGLPVQWEIEGASTFGNKIDESFALQDGTATWRDSTGDGSASPESPSIYVAQEGSPWSLWIYANALMQTEDRKLPALPGGELRLETLQELEVSGNDNTLDVTAYALSGTGLNPTYFLLDTENSFFALITPRFLVIREGYEAEGERLRNFSADLSTDRYVSIQAKTANNFNAPVRIRNVRVFDPTTLSLTGPVSVIVEGQRISDIQPLRKRTRRNEYEIDGAGGTLIAGMYDMHGHMGQNSALLNIAAGVTSVRDMGNNTEVLDDLVARIKDGTLAGPRIIRSGFIEGKSPFSSNNGILVENEEQAVNAVRQYADRGFHQIKVYNSMKGEWVPAIVEEARKHGMPVAGHVPAFSNANQMIRAGYNEMTHINQVMLGWVLSPEEDTRTLLRLTALKRLPELDLESEQVLETLDLMVENNVAIDPTLAIHEALLLSRNGELQRGVVDYVDNMPVGVQRQAKVAWADISTPEDDAAYRGAYDQIIRTVRKMHDRGIFIVPGTDLGGSFAYHRELELYQDAGFSAAEMVRRATWDMADYVGQAEDLGSIEPGKLADFFLVPGNPTEDLKAIKTISMVVKDGTFYFPTEIYPEFGIKPFIEAPGVKEPKKKR